LLKEKLDYIDAWAYYYEPKNEMVYQIENEALNLKLLNHTDFDSEGNLVFYQNVNTRSELFSLPAGNYDLIVKGRSSPMKPINGENSHIIIKINGNEIANFNLSEKPEAMDHTFPFKIDNGQKLRLQLIYDNDIFEKGQDRNAIINSIKFKKK
jgi:hypothetical protein